MQRFLLIPDKFKGSLTAQQVIEGISKGIEKSLADCKITSMLASDGGDGFLHSVAAYLPIEMVDVETVDPLGRPLVAPIGFDKTNKTAYVELALTSGIVLLKDEEKNPMNTSTYGTGLQIKKALGLGATKIYLGIGGSATNDGATGIAKALGYRFIDIRGEELKPIGKNLDRINVIQNDYLHNDVSFFAINDVSNPLYGPKGAASIYGRQKGASDVEVKQLDSGLRNLDKVVIKDLNLENAHITGSGSAGGTGYGLKTFCNATYVSGIEFLLKLAKVDSLLKEGKIDCIVTGEGAIDEQTLYGKLISGVLKVARQYDIPVIGVCGIKQLNKSEEDKLGLSTIIEIADKTKSLEYNMKNAQSLLVNKVCEYFKST